MKRIAILTAGGDTPALNATIHGAVTYANQREIEVLGLLAGFNALLQPAIPIVRLNPLFQTIPELDPTYGGTVLGSSRTYVHPEETERQARMRDALAALDLDGLICIGGDGTMNGLQPLCRHLPVVLAPKTIDNDLGLNYPKEPEKYDRIDPDSDEKHNHRVRPDFQAQENEPLDLEQMVNYVTPGYATAVYVSSHGVTRVRTTAESHRRVAIIEVMGRHSGFIALGSAYGQPDLILIPEFPIDPQAVATRVQQIFERQQNVVIVCGEGIVTEAGELLGGAAQSTDPAGNVLLSGAAEALRAMLIASIGDAFFEATADKSASRAIFTRKVGHTQRGGRPIYFDQFYGAQLGGQAVRMLVEGQNNAVSTLGWSADDGFQVAATPGSVLRDRWGRIHAREVHRSFYDPAHLRLSPHGIEYLLPIFTNAIAADDMEHIRSTLFDSGNLTRPYHSVNADIAKRTEYVERR